MNRVLFNLACIALAMAFVGCGVLIKPPNTAKMIKENVHDKVGIKTQTPEEQERARAALTAAVEKDQRAKAAKAREQQEARERRKRTRTTSTSTPPPTTTTVKSTKQLCYSKRKGSSFDKVCFDDKTAYCGSLCRETDMTNKGKCQSECGR